MIGKNSVKIIGLTLVCLGFILFWPSLILAAPATYYVDVVNGNDSNTGTQAAPLKTIQKAIGIASAGDRVIVKHGDYRNQGRIIITKSGNATAGNIVFEAEGQVITKGFSVFNKNTWQKIDYITIKGFDVTDTISDLYDGVGIFVYGSNNIIENNHVYNTQRQGIYIYADNYDTRNNLVKNNLIENTGLDGDQLDAGIKVHGQNQTVESNELKNINVKTILDFYLAKNSIIKNNQLHNNAGCIAALALWSANSNTLDNNRFNDNNCYHGILLTESSNNIIRNNEVANTFHSDTFQGSGIVVYNQSNNNLVQNNKSYASSHVGFVVFSADNNQLINNQSYQNGGAGIHLGGNAASNVVEKNEVYQNSQKTDDTFGIDLLQVGNDNIVRYNKIHNQHDTFNDPSIGPNPGNPAGSPKYGTGGIRFDGGGQPLEVDHYYSTGNKAYYNLIYQEYNGLQIFNFDNIEMYNNTIYDSQYVGLQMSSYDANRPVSNEKIKNNIIYNVKSGVYLIFISNLVNSEINNNLYSQNGSEQFLNNWVTLSFSAWQSSTGQDANSKVGNPLFIAPTNFDFNLSTGSPAIDQGVEVGLSQDYAGRPVPKGSAPDIGALEKQTIEAPAIEFTEVPAYGDTVGILRGQAKNIDYSLYQVVTYIQGADLVWYPKPNASVLITINSDGSWSQGIVTHPNDRYATKIVSYLVPINASVPACWPTLCLSLPQISQAVASQTFVRPITFSPYLEFISVPPLGDQQGILQGRAMGVDFSQYKIVTYIKGQDTVWYPKPNTSALITINSDGSWIQGIVTHPNDKYATQVASYLVPNNTSVPACWPNLCLSQPQISQAVAQTTVTR